MWHIKINMKDKVILWITFITALISYILIIVGSEYAFAPALISGIFYLCLLYNTFFEESSRMIGNYFIKMIENYSIKMINSHLF